MMMMLMVISNSVSMSTKLVIENIELLIISVSVGLKKYELGKYNNFHSILRNDLKSKAFIWFDYMFKEKEAVLNRN